MSEDKPKPEDIGKKIATVHICMREKGIVFRFKKPEKTDDRIKFLVMSTVERMEKEWSVVKDFTPADLEKWKKDGKHYFFMDNLDTPATLALQNILREKENTSEIEKAYR